MRSRKQRSQDQRFKAVVEREARKTAIIGALILVVGCSDTGTNPSDDPDPTNNPEPQASQTVTTDAVTLVYTSSVLADSARLTLMGPSADTIYEGEVPTDTAFVGPTPTDSFGLFKGEYQFVLLAWRGQQTTTDTVFGKILDLPTQPPVVAEDLSFDEEGQITVVLPDLVDPNREDTPSYQGVSSLDGKTTVLLQNGNELVVTGAKDSTGIYEVQLDYIDPVNDTQSITVGDTIRGFTDIRGVLQESFAGTDQAGIVRVYRQDSTLLLEIPVGTEGFDTELAERPDRLIVQAMMVLDGVDSSYVRTDIFLVEGGADLMGLEIRLLRRSVAADLGLSASDFRTHMNESNFEANAETDRSLVVDFDSLQGIYLLKVNTVLGQGVMSDSLMDDIVDTFRSELDRLFPQNSIQIVKDDGSGIDHVAFTIQDEQLTLSHGWRLVVSDTTISYSGLVGLVDDNGDGYIDRATARYNIERAVSVGLANWQTVKIHELFHLLFGLLHPMTFRSRSIMGSSEGNTFPQQATDLDIATIRTLTLYAGPNARIEDRFRLGFGFANP